METITVGSVRKLHGVDGKLRVRFDHPLKGKKIPYLIVDTLPYFVKDIHDVSQGEYLIRFEEITSREEAKKLAGLVLEMKVEDTEKYFEISAPVYPEITGFEAFDQKGEAIGLVTEFREMPMQTILVLSLNETEILIPFHEGTIFKIAEKDRRVSLNIPEGLIDLYL